MSERVFRTGETLVIVAGPGMTSETRERAFNAAMAVHAGGVIVLPHKWKALNISELQANIDALKGEEQLHAKRSPPKSQPCPGGKTEVKSAGDKPCPKCGRIIGAKRGLFGGWYLAEHKMPAEAKV